jgi:LDH2 family malate/lactate/ureidoglycolate dehydrogenase
MTWQVGSWIFDDASKPSFHNAAFIAIDISAMGPPEQFEKRLQRLIDEIHATKTAPGIKRVLLPGEREWELHRHSQTAGILLPADVLEKLGQAAKHAGIASPIPA